MSDKLVEQQVVYDGKKVRLEVHDLEDERSGRRYKKEIVVHPGAVVIMGFLPDGRLLLIRNRRYTVGRTLTELPAGTLEKNEDPKVCAGRELLEETGYAAGRIEPIGSFFASPGILTERMHAFAAYDLQHRGQSLEADEQIEVLPVTLPDAVAMITDGRIEDGKTIATVLLYERLGAGRRRA